MSRWDVAVVGAGPAGSLAARELARRGASVILLERERIPRRKVCGGCLGPAALSTLARVGLQDLPMRLGAVPLSRMQLSTGGRSATLPLGGSVALSRSVLDEALTHAASAAGVTVVDGIRVRVRSIASDGVHLEPFAGASSPRHEKLDEIEASIVLDASGLGGSVTGHLPGQESACIALASRIGLGAGFLDPEPRADVEDLHMVVGSAGYVGIVRVEDGSLNVAAALNPERLRNSNPGKEIRTILDGTGIRLDGEPPHEWKGTPPLTRTPGSPSPDRVFRIGDAAGYVEPFTGEGMGWAFADALRVVPYVEQALKQWDPELGNSWERHQRDWTRSATRMCRAVAWGVRRPRLVHSTISLLRHAPRLASPFINHSARVPSLP